MRRGGGTGRAPIWTVRAFWIRAGRSLWGGGSFQSWNGGVWIVETIGGPIVASECGARNEAVRHVWNKWRVVLYNNTTRSRDLVDFSKTEFVRVGGCRGGNRGIGTYCSCGGLVPGVGRCVVVRGIGSPNRGLGWVQEASDGRACVGE